MASLQTCGTVSVFHPSLNSCSSFFFFFFFFFFCFLFLLRGPRCRSISICNVVGTGERAFLDFSVDSACSSSLVTKGFLAPSRGHELAHWQTAWKTDPQLLSVSTGMCSFLADPQFSPFDQPDLEASINLPCSVNLLTPPAGAFLVGGTCVMQSFQAHMEIRDGKCHRKSAILRYTKLSGSHGNPRW